MKIDLGERLASTAFAFRGYNVTNQGRSHELLAHAAFGPLVRRFLAAAADVCASTLGRPADLAGRVERQEPSSLTTFAEDIATIVAIEAAQIQVLREVYDIEYANARLAFGYSLGEVAALVCGGVYHLEHVLPPLLQMADECAELAADVSMGVVFSRGAVLDLDVVGRLTAQINAEGRGVIGISANLSPNTVLLLGQQDTIERFKQRSHDAFPEPVHVRANSSRWPPLHTPLLWDRNIPNRAAVAMRTIPGGTSAPVPPVLSLVTGKVSYNDYNSREILARWIDHPQRLWDAVYEVLVSGVDTVIHVGPETNLIPATFKRLSNNVQQQLSRRSLGSLSLRAMSGMVRRPWLGKLLSSRTALLRAPFVRHVVLEDWLLEQAAG